MKDKIKYKNLKFHSSNQHRFFFYLICYFILYTAVKKHTCRAVISFFFQIQRTRTQYKFILNKP